jgi:hypothetical protein
MMMLPLAFHFELSTLTALGFISITHLMRMI